MKHWLARALITVACWAAPAWAQAGGELRFCLHAEPKTFDPRLVADEASETIRYLTGGVLIRVNRLTQELQPELATSWTVGKDGKSIAFSLRQGVSFSDGTPLSADDVAYTMRTLMDPNLHSPTADPFRTGAGTPVIKTSSGSRVRIEFPAPVSGLEQLFDQVAIMSASSPKKEAAVLGPFYLEAYKPGFEIVLKKNPRYWKRDAAGIPLPYLDGIRLPIQQNREIEVMRFRRGELDLISNLDAELFTRLATQMPESVRDAGPSLESEMLWFNQAPQAPLPAHKKVWFRSKAFRRAVSGAIRRNDLCKVVYRGHAHPAEGSISPANRFWFNSKLKPHAFDLAGARQGLARDGFQWKEGKLLDREGNPVEFSVVTNSGNKSRERMAAMIQQDLAAIGIKLNVVLLDFGSLLERITRSFDYEACLMGLSNVDLDPSAQMNVWLSTAANHQWNPGQKSPATAWEAEIDKLMLGQAAALDRHRRKALFDRVQEIVSDEAPFLYLVTKNSLMAFSPSLRNVNPAFVGPQAYWNVERLAKDRREN